MKEYTGYSSVFCPLSEREKWWIGLRYVLIHELCTENSHYYRHTYYYHDLREDPLQTCETLARVTLT